MLGTGEAQLWQHEAQPGLRRPGSGQPHRDPEDPGGNLQDPQGVAQALLQSLQGLRGSPYSQVQDQDGGVRERAL